MVTDKLHNYQSFRFIFTIKLIQGRAPTETLPLIFFKEFPEVHFQQLQTI
jgi:hypothetical protein